MTNEGQLPMMNNMLNSAQKAGWDMSLFHCYLTKSNKMPASYASQQFQSLTLRKLKLILHNVRMSPEVLWVDNDIVFFENSLDNIRSYSGDFVMQDDLWGYCTGFFLIRQSPASIAVLERAIRYLEKARNPAVNDQHAFNADTSGAVITKLPQDEYPNGQVYFNERRTDRATMVHCNYLTTTAEKVVRLQSVGLWDESETGSRAVHRYVI